MSLARCHVTHQQFIEVSLILMISVLIILAFIIAISLLFWLDRKDKEDKEKGERIWEEVLKLFNRVDWGKTLAELKEKFPDKKLLNFQEESIGLVGTGYRDKLDGQDVSVRFYLSENGEDKVVRADIYFTDISKNKLDTLFRKLCEKYGSPLLKDETEEKPVFWDTKKGILTLETSTSQTLLLSVWNSKLYNYITIIRPIKK